MKQKRSMDEALLAAKELRKQVTHTLPAAEPTSDPHLKVVGQSEEAASISTGSQKPPPPVHGEQQSSQLQSYPKPHWVRHTVGLLDSTSLQLRDAADGQKRKARHGQLQPGEPATEQEIANLGITLALKQLGYL